MAVSVVQSKTVALGSLFAGDGIAELSFDAPCTSGNRIVVDVGTAQSSRDITSITDNGSGTSYTEVAGSDLTTGEPSRSWRYISSVLSSTPSQVTVNLSSATAAEAMITLYEIAGSHATTPVEDISTLDNAGTPGTTHTLPDVDAAAAGSLLLLMQWMNGTGSYTIDADFTQVYNNARGVGGWDQVNAGTFNAVVTSAGSEGGISVLNVIQPAAAAPAGNQNRMLMGVG